MTRIIHKCKQCGWQKSIVKEWQDIKPRKCMNRSCGASFIKNPELLETIEPQEVVPQQPKKKNKKDGE